MTKNMGRLDRGLRAFIVVPLALVLAVVVGAASLVGIIFFVVAGIMLGTALTGFCPTYTLLGISTGPGGVHHVRRGIRHGHA